MKITNTTSFGVIAIITVGFLFFLFSSPVLMCGKMESNLNKTLYEEFKPEELLRKYEWFKDASAQMDSKLATLHIYQARFDKIQASYGTDSTNRRVWNDNDREQWNIWESEFVGLKASYNDLASQYNAAMVKFNYRFCNAGSLPHGASTVLPREYRQYLQ